MKEIKTIVVPIDFFYSTEKLVEYAVYMANKLSAVLHFIHAVSLYQGDAMWGSPYAFELKDKIEAQARERMANLIEDLQGRNPGCSGQVVEGEPVDCIVDFAKSQGANLIIISTHGAKGLEKILLGSVTERVLKRAHCPVLVMNPFKSQI